jgi:Ca2+-binding RTX toxin-like protein
VRAAGLAVLALLASAAPASGATVSTRIVIEDPSNHAIFQDPVDSVTVTGGPEADALDLTLDGSFLVVRDPAGMQAGDGCSTSDAVTARCELKGIRRRLVLDAGAGADTVRVGTPFASARLAGGDGDDRLEDLQPGAASLDELTPTGVTFDGGAGADVMTGNGGAAVTYEGRDDPVTVVLGRDVAQGAPGEGDRIAGASWVRGGDGPDRLTAVGAGLHLRGGGGGDTLTAAAEGSDLRGERGDDVLRGGRGPDLLAGGPGSDRLRGGPGRDDLFGGSGLQAQGAYDPFAADVDGRAGDRDRLDGGRGDDQLATGAGRDTLIGGPGADVIGVPEAGVFGEDLLLGPGDRARARDASRDVVRCSGRRLRVAADARDVTLGCRAGLHRIGRPRPGFTGAIDDLGFAVEDATFYTGVGCPDDMPGRCRFAYRVLDGRRVIGRKASSARPGREAAPDIHLDRVARRRALCSGRVNWRLEVRTQTAAGSPLTLRRSVRGRIERDPDMC